MKEICATAKSIARSLELAGTRYQDNPQSRIYISIYRYVYIRIYVRVCVYETLCCTQAAPATADIV